MRRQVERIRRLAASKPLARQVGFWWGLAEGTFFFVVPDVYISLATLFSLSAGATAWGFSILGSLVAIPLIHLLVVVLGIDYLAVLEGIPAISAPMIGQVIARLGEDGLPYTPLLVLGGVPLKVYGGAAFSLGFPLASVMVWTVFARIVRILPTYAIAGGARLLFGHRIDARPGPWLALFLGAWVTFYAFYFSKMSAAGSGQAGGRLIALVAFHPAGPPPAVVERGLVLQAPAATGRARR